MIVNVWLIVKKGEPRIYTTTVQPDDERLAAWRRDGFKVFRVQTQLPHGWDMPDAELYGRARDADDDEED